jgi:hypothetical protein
MMGFYPLAWNSSLTQASDGVLVGADITQEWLLPWWWEHYSKYNRSPVAFIDFGMSFEKKDWCRNHGKLIPLRIGDDFIKQKSEIDPAMTKKFEDQFGENVWTYRSIWFKKPIACLSTPFLRTLWIDIDCEIRGPIDPLFSYVDQGPEISLALDQWFPFTEHPLYDHPFYNSGVIVFRRTEFIVRWARECFEKNELFHSDDAVLSSVIAEESSPVYLLPPQYNWSRLQKEDKEAIVLHWHGKHGKEVIRMKMHLSQLFSEDIC